MAESCDPSRVWFTDLVGHIASFLPTNDIALGLRLVNRAAADQFAKHTRVMLSQAMSPAAFAIHWSAPEACRGLTLPQRRQLLCLTAASGVVANLEVALAAAGCVLTGEVAEAAASAKQTEVCRWLAAPGRLPAGVACQHTLFSAAHCGDQGLCEWALASGAAWRPEAVAAAAQGGHTALVESLLALRPAATRLGDALESVVQASAEGCDLAALQGLVERSGGLAAWPEWSRVPLLAGALGSPTPDWQAKTEWLLAQGCPPSDAALSRAAALPGPQAVERLAWLGTSQHGWSLGPQALACSAAAGNVQALGWLLKEGLRSEDAYAVQQAAQSGSLGVLQALATAKCALDPAQCAQAAARGGRLSVLQWLLETYGAERLGGWSERLAAEGCASGSVEVVGWLRERGCAFASEECWARAASSGCEAALELLSGYGCPLPVDGSPYTAAARNGDLRTLSVLRRLGLGWGSAETFARAVWESREGAGAPMGALRWLAEEGCPVEYRRVVASAHLRQTPDQREVLVWLRAQRKE